MTAEPCSRSCVRIVLAVLSGCGLAALAWASFVPPAAHIIYNPSDSVPIGWYRIRPTGPTHIGSIVLARLPADVRSEEHTSELQSLMRNSYAVFCLQKQI